MKQAQSLFISAVLVLFFTSCKCSDNTIDIGFSDAQKVWFDSIPTGSSSLDAVSTFGETDLGSVNKEYTTGITYKSRRLKCDQGFKFDNCNVYYSVSNYLFIFKLSSEYSPAKMEVDFHNYNSSYASFCNLYMNLDKPTEIHSVYYHPFYSLDLPQSEQIPNDTLIRNTSFSDLYRVAFDLPPTALNTCINKVWISKSYGLVAFQLLNGNSWYLYP